MDISFPLAVLSSVSGLQVTEEKLTNGKHFLILAVVVCLFLFFFCLTYCYCLQLNSSCLPV